MTCTIRKIMLQIFWDASAWWVKCCPGLMNPPKMKTKRLTNRLAILGKIFFSSETCWSSRFIFYSFWSCLAATFWVIFLLSLDTSYSQTSTWDPTLVNSPKSARKRRMSRHGSEESLMSSSLILLAARNDTWAASRTVRRRSRYVMVGAGQKKKSTAPWRSNR